MKPAALPVEGESVVELDHRLGGQITCGQHLQSLDQLHHGIVVLSVPQSVQRQANDTHLQGHFCTAAVCVSAPVCLGMKTAGS